MQSVVRLLPFQEGVVWPAEIFAAENVKVGCRCFLLTGITAEYARAVGHINSVVIPESLAGW